MKRLIQLTIETKKQSVELSIKPCPNGKYYWIDAITETGFSLCSDHWQDDRYLKTTQPKNTQLRSPKSIKAEMESVLSAYESKFKEIQNEIILTETTIEARMNGGETLCGPPGHWSIHAPSIKSLQSNECLSWHYHDVFKDSGTITLTVRRNSKGYLRYYANENDLYCAEKLKRLASKDGVKNKNYSFFFYEELNRLVGRPHGNTKAMSGLFK